MENTDWHTYCMLRIIMTQCWLHFYDAFGWRKKHGVHHGKKRCFFTKKDEILIKVLRQSKGYSARKFLEEFSDKDWSCSALDQLLRQIDATGSADRKSGSSREGTVCKRDVQTSVQMATTFSTNCNWWYCVLTAKATFPYWKLLFGVPFFKQLLLKNCAVDFAEICNLCTGKVIIKDAKRIFNSDKICGSYCDFYFGVTFFGTHCISIGPFSMTRLDLINWRWCQNLNFQNTVLTSSTLLNLYSNMYSHVNMTCTKNIKQRNKQWLIDWVRCNVPPNTL